MNPSFSSDQAFDVFDDPGTYVGTRCSRRAMLFDLEHNDARYDEEKRTRSSHSLMPMEVFMEMKEDNL